MIKEVVLSLRTPKLACVGLCLCVRLHNTRKLVIDMYSFSRFPVYSYVYIQETGEANKDCIPLVPQNHTNKFVQHNLRKEGACKKERMTSCSGSQYNNYSRVERNARERDFKTTSFFSCASLAGPPVARGRGKCSLFPFLFTNPDQTHLQLLDKTASDLY